VADGDKGFRVIDVSDPTDPTEAGNCDTPGNAYDVAVGGSYAYVADGGSGLRVIYVFTPTTPTPVGAYDTLGVAYGVALDGSYAYVADDWQGVRVMDISSPSSPIEMGAYDPPDKWGVRGIYYAGAPEVFEQGILNPDEEVVIEINIYPPVKIGTTGRAIVATPNGVSASILFNR